MRNCWRLRTPQVVGDDHSTIDGVAFPPLSRDKPSRRQMRESRLASSPSEIVNQEDHNASVVVRDLSSSPQEHSLSSASGSDNHKAPQEHNLKSASSDVPDLSSASRVRVVVPDLSSSPQEHSLSSASGSDNHKAPQEHNFQSASSDVPDLSSPQEHNLSSVSDVPDLSHVVPDLSSSLLSPEYEYAAETEKTTEEHNLLSTSVELQTGNKDWSPADDAETCPDLLPTEAQTGFLDGQDRVISRTRKRLECFTKHCVDGERPRAETTVAQKPDSSSSGKGTMSANCWSTTKNPATEATHETLSLALFPPLTGEKQSKKQMRNNHLAPKQHHE